MEFVVVVAVLVAGALLLPRVAAGRRGGNRVPTETVERRSPGRD